MTKPSRPRLRRAQRPLPFKWVENHLKIIKLIARFRYLTAEMVNRAMGFAPASIKYTRVLLSELYHGHYLNAITWQMHIGSAPRVYYVDTRGKTVLQGIGMPTQGIPQNHEAAERELRVLRHTILTNEVLITCHLAPEPIQLTDFLSPYEVLIHLRGKGHPIPDAWTNLEVLAVCWEIDMGTESSSSFLGEKGKVAKYVEFEEPYKKLFHTDSMAVVFVVQQPERAKRLTRWIELGLQELKREKMASLFRVGVFFPDTSPEEFFFIQPWLRPFREVPEPLLRRQ